MPFIELATIEWCAEFMANRDQFRFVVFTAPVPGSSLPGDDDL